MNAPPPLLPPDELAELQRSLHRVVGLLQRYDQRMSPREFLAMAIGLRSAHIEEAIAHGEWDRARAHIDRLGPMVQGLSKVG